MDESFNLMHAVCLSSGKQKPACIGSTLRYFDISNYFDYTI